MEWFYRLGGQEYGPISTHELKVLFKARTIKAETRVRRGDRLEWKPLQQYVKAEPTAGAAAPPGWRVPSVARPDIPPSSACTECGRVFFPDELIWIDDARVCAACKPLFIQKLRAAAPDQDSLHYAGFWIRFVAKFIDGLVLLAFNMAVGLVFVLAAGVSNESMADSASLQLVFQCIGLAYATFFIGRFGATPGKMACGLKVVSPDGGAIGYGRALARQLAEYLSALILMIGYIMAAFDSEKRALHDRICRTRVVRN